MRVFKARVENGFRLIDMRNVDGNQLIDSDDPDDIVLAILCKTDECDMTTLIRPRTSSG
ncbi:MAG: hypothetical protein HQL03_01635 [Nitrospirae bacterium]|nr:hypothetical protein [Nitrospirota bacterium]